MYSFGNRKDCTVSDEPFYAAYLAATGADHPMRKDVLGSQAHDPGEVIRALLQPNPGGHSIWYQKHMTHHMLPRYNLDWISELRNVFLIRDPRKIVASYAKKRSSVDFSDLGFEEQMRIFQHCRDQKLDPIVLDSDYILQGSTNALTLLCQKLGVPFDPAMTHWTPGKRAEDGVWAAHWYDAVHRSSGFSVSQETTMNLPDAYRPILDRAMPIYEELRAFAIT